MSLRTSTVKGAMLLGSGHAVAQGLAFVRTVIIARLLTQADFGVAGAMALTIFLLEAASNLAADKLLVQSRNGDERRFEGVLHTFEVGRGVLSGAIIFAAAGPLASLFDVPEATWAFQTLALAPVIRGFRHLDVQRFQRHMRFGPSVAAEVGSQAVMVAAAWPLAAWLGDYSAVLWLVLGREVARVTLSHALAERPYTLAWDAAQARAALTFGWPLLLNSLLIYAGSEGDRLLVGATFGVADLGVYTAAAYLAMMPAIALARLHSTLALPLLSRAQEDKPSFMRRHALSLNAVTLIAGVMAVCFITVGRDVLVLVYGQKYAVAAGLVVWLGVAHAIRLVRTAGATSAIALADTKNPLISNVARMTGLAGVVAALAVGADLWVVAAMAAVGETCALIATMARLKFFSGLRAQPVLLPLSAALCVGFASAAVTLYTPRFEIRVLVACAGTIAVALLTLATSPAVRLELGAFLRHSRPALGRLVAVGR